MNKWKIGWLAFLVALVASIGTNMLLGSENTILKEQVSDISATFVNLSSNACAVGCNVMLNLLHTNDTNVNAQLLASCWGSCGININS